ncbi:MAG TPA: hypothetical protein DHW02_00545, partial [Ktedonobacter sp.]|nr:hypothetical protein [Ktedonobacter sp.]
MSALLSNLGSASYELGNYGQAEDYFIKGIQETLQIYNREWLSLLYINLGMVLREQKRYKEAKQQMK